MTTSPEPKLGRSEFVSVGATVGVTTALGDGEPTRTARLSLPVQQARVEETQPKQRSATRR